jgi:hypothetical protein
MKILEMYGKTIVDINGGHNGSELLSFHDNDGNVYGFSHEQDCCEVVNIEDIIGDMNDLLNYPIVEATVTTNEDNEDDEILWTFYRFSTVKGTVTVRWLGTSNGYYSRSVDFWITDRQGQDVPCKQCQVED